MKKGNNKLQNAGILSLLFLCFICMAGSSSIVESGPYEFVYPANFGNRINVPDDNPATKQGVYLGRLLFYDKHLSVNNSMSCGTCHQQAKAFTDGRVLSIGVDQTQTPRNAMSLANLLWTRRFFWDGRSNGLEEQATIPMANPHEMGQSLDRAADKIRAIREYGPLFKLVYGDTTVTGARIVKAIAQFERTLISCNSRYDRYLAQRYEPTADELAGMTLFNTAPQPEKGIRGANCVHCHGGPKTYMELFHNNGLDSVYSDKGVGEFTGIATDMGRFKAPTLRNIALTAPYMHDGRFKTLAEVIDHYSDHIVQSKALSAFLQNESNIPGGKSLELQPKEKRQLIAFLNMLTDSTFITDQRFSDPNLKTKH